MRRGAVATLLLWALSSALGGGRRSAAAPAVYHEDFEHASPETGLPAEWSVRPASLRPWVGTAADREVFGASAPSLRVDLPLRSLDYQIRTSAFVLPDSGDYTVEMSLRIEQPDYTFRADAVVFDPAGNWLESFPLLTISGADEREFRTRRVSFHHQDASGPRFCMFFFGLPYSKEPRGGRWWMDDLEVRPGREAGALALYPTPADIAAGDTVALHISGGKGSAALRVFREGATRTLTYGPVELTGLREEEVPEDTPENGCRWPVRYSLATDAGWQSGVYVLSIDDGDRTAESMFVIRGKGTEGKVLVVLPTHTDQAYDDWGGRSFYTHPRTCWDNFERPSRRELSLFYFAPIHLIRWLEREGIGYGVMTDDGLNEHPEVLSGYPGLILVGHSEYWTRAMRQNVEAFRARGGSLLCLAGNTCWWQTRTETGPEGSRRLVCYKADWGSDPYRFIDPSLVTGRWDLPPVNEPTERFLGLSYRFGGTVNWGTSTVSARPYDWLDGHGGYTAWNTGSWVFAGTGLHDGDTFGREQAIVGYEVDGVPLDWSSGRPSVAAGTQALPAFTVLGTAPAFSDLTPDSTGTAVMGIAERVASYTFNGGTVGWSWGLDSDPVVRRITRNLIDRLPERLPPPPARLRIRAFPSVARGPVQVELLGSPMPLQVYVISSDGRRVASIPVRRRGPGYALARWDLRDSSGRDVPSGIFWMTAEGTSAQAVIRAR